MKSKPHSRGITKERRRVKEGSEEGEYSLYRNECIIFKTVEGN
jgi:hypothetical protein